jgi:hypothetical protein
MEEPGEQCTVVFALPVIVTELASECLCVEGGGCHPLTVTLAGILEIYANMTVHCSPDPSMQDTQGNFC